MLGKHNMAAILVCYVCNRSWIAHLSCEFPGFSQNDGYNITLFTGHLEIWSTAIVLFNLIKKESVKFL